MKFLLDTHTFIWYSTASFKLSIAAREIIDSDDRQLYLSIASIWEMAIKVSIGKLRFQTPFNAIIPELLQWNEIEILPIELRHAFLLSTLPYHHRDPFDRMIIAQCATEEMPVVSMDAAFDAYPVKRIW